MQLPTIAIMLLTLAGFTLRLRYLTGSHPFFDEFTTVLAARQTLQQGWPLLPSGLFYEHGLLATYLITPFTAMFVNIPLAEWQPAHWGLMLARWPSLLLSTATIPLIYSVTRTCLTHPKYGLAETRASFASPALSIMAGLLAAGLFAISPEGVVWGGRARMYALATLLMLLTVAWAYRGATRPALAPYRWLALTSLLATLLTQFGAILLVPPLTIAMLVMGWLSWQQPEAPSPAQRLTAMPWFLQKSIILEALALAAILLLAIFVKRLGQPLGVAPLGQSGSTKVAEELLDTIAYQVSFHLSWPDTVSFFARQFGVPHHYWLTILTLSIIAAGVAVWGWQRLQGNAVSFAFGPFQIFLWLFLGLTLLEIVTLLEPFRRNPRYLVMVLPAYYVVVAGAVVYPLQRISRGWLPQLKRPGGQTIAALGFLAVAFIIGYNDLMIALLTPEPAYEDAMAYVAQHRQPGDVVLTMNTSAAVLYLNQADGFTVQNEAEQFLLERDEGAIDRWTGAPWLGRSADFVTVLNNASRVWFVTDTIRQPVYFQGDWQATLNSQMEQVWARDNAVVYLTRSERLPLPVQPEKALDVTLDGAIKLLGFTLKGDTSASALHLTLFWQPLKALPADYTTFLHLRNARGEIVAQTDSQPLAGVYPTSQWRPGETVVDPIVLPLPNDLPEATYALFTGLYRLDTLERLPVVPDVSGENAILLGTVSNEQ